MFLANAYPIHQECQAPTEGGETLSSKGIGPIIRRKQSLRKTDHFSGPVNIEQKHQSPIVKLRQSHLSGGSIGTSAAGGIPTNAGGLNVVRKPSKSFSIPM